MPKIAAFNYTKKNKDVYNIPLPDKKEYQELISAITENGKLKVVPAEIYRAFSQEALTFFSVENGYYCLPTTELIEWLKANMGTDPVEICAASGIIAKALNIPACDNFQQDRSEINLLYKKMGQKVVPYDYRYVKNREALSYVKKFQPHTVIAAWATHKYNIRKHDLDGNMYGVDEAELLKYSRYIHIGNLGTHEIKPIMSLPHQQIYPDWLFSRSIFSKDNFIGIWERYQ